MLNSKKFLSNQIPWLEQVHHVQQAYLQNLAIHTFNKLLHSSLIKLHFEIQYTGYNLYSKFRFVL